ncbi:hypothetical protein FQN52_003803 [Onygenales sp. PD_12]|nr:hypothetical protein FQN53_005790 [Emmonsiellopsis sp. PD_33]KAK2776223.1 hypothetical protein FQN52_003803 [Onygenales sp. PD_12]KAK2792085.1 hypothetical protein FQN51_001923 [Onygenales sp. PD_10]
MVTSHGDSMTSKFPVLGWSLVIGTCTWPTTEFTVTGSNSFPTIYPRAVCSTSEDNKCCPVGGTVSTPLTSCPRGYATIGQSACCPEGWSIYTTALGTETPCYHPLETTVSSQPTTPPPNNGPWTIRNTLFATKYDLNPRHQTTLLSLATPTATSTSQASPETPPPSHNISKGAVAGIAIGSAVGSVLLLIIALYLIRRRNRTPRPFHSNTSLIDSMIRPPAKDVHELGSTEAQPAAMALSIPPHPPPPRPPTSASESRTIGDGTMQSVPVMYDPYISPVGNTRAFTPTIRTLEPQELEGNTFINEYHPAFRNEAGSRQQ